MSIVEKAEVDKLLDADGRARIWRADPQTERLSLSVLRRANKESGAR